MFVLTCAQVTGLNCNYKIVTETDTEAMKTFTEHITKMHATHDQKNLKETMEELLEDQ